MFYSQAGQDEYVLNRFGNKGVFVDVGAHDGIESSNTYALEKAGWEGICIEPNRESFAKLNENRRSINLNVGVSDKWVLDKFHKLSSLLGAFEYDTINYLSIDTDGMEMEVLRGMDFKLYRVEFITIEHNQYLEGEARQQQIFEYLTAQGFRRSHKDVKCLDPNYFGLIYEDWYENVNDKP